MLSIYLVLPEVELDIIKDRTRKGLRQGMKEGRWMHPPPKGFNAPRYSSDRILTPNDDAQFVLKGFEMIAEGAYSIDEVGKMLKKEGFNYSKSSVHRMLRHTVYAGKILIPEFKDEDEQIIDGLHEAIVPENLFDKVQELLDGRKKVHIKRGCRDEKLPLRNHLICAKCNYNQLLTGSGTPNKQKKIYHYYHCDAKTCKNDTREYIRADKANKAFVEYLMDMRYTDEAINLLYAMIENMCKKNESYRESKFDRIDRAIQECKDLLNNLEDKYLGKSGVYSDIEYANTKKRYRDKISSLNKEKLEKEVAEADILAKLDKCLPFLQNFSNTYEMLDILGKHKFIGAIFPEKLYFEKNAYRTPHLNEVISLIINKDVAFKDSKMKKAVKNNSLSHGGWKTGLEPATP
ncbi:MAG: recombinase family protein [Bacteroidia bacterium]|nr:recombinase family protein [Bacteroidia bacterium]